jgi:hypothetical protein
METGYELVLRNCIRMSLGGRCSGTGQAIAESIEGIGRCRTTAAI